MSSLQHIFRKFLSSLSIIGGFLILVYLFGKFRQSRRSKNIQQQQLRNLVSQIDDKNRLKRDKIIWFFQLSLFTSFTTLFSLIVGLISVQYQFKGMNKLFSLLQINTNMSGFYMKMFLALQIIICIILYKLIYYYENQIVKQVILCDQEVQEQNDRLKKLRKDIIKQEENNQTTIGQKDIILYDELESNIIQSQYQKTKKNN